MDISPLFYLRLSQVLIAIISAYSPKFTSINSGLKCEDIRGVRSAPLGNMKFHDNSTPDFNDHSLGRPLPLLCKTLRKIIFWADNSLWVRSPSR